MSDDDDKLHQWIDDAVYRSFEWKHSTDFDGLKIIVLTLRVGVARIAQAKSPVGTETYQSMVDRALSQARRNLEKR